MTYKLLRAIVIIITSILDAWKIDKMDCDNYRERFDDALRESGYLRETNERLGQEIDRLRDSARPSWPKIPAIKSLRWATGLDLRDAKELCEAHGFDPLAAYLAHYGGQSEERITMAELREHNAVLAEANATLRKRFGVPEIE